MKPWKLCLLIFISKMVYCARILCVYPVPSHSHQLVYRALTKELLKCGHEVVVITPAPYRPENETKLKEIDVSFSLAAFKNRVKDLATKASSPVKDFHNILLRGATEAFEMQVESPEIQQLLQNSTEHFDLLILQCVLRLSYFYKHRFRGVPVIGFSPLMGVQFNYEATGTPNDPTLYPDLFRAKMGELTLLDKLQAIYVDFYQKYAYWASAEEDNRIGRKYFGEDTPDIRELVYNDDLIFLNVHPVWDGIRPTPPNVIYVGGLHITPPKELPKDLKDYLDGCHRGVVYMSLGSNLKSSELPPDKVRMILQAFAELPYCVLWKWETEDMPGKPDNVKLYKWLPQADLLAHPNILVFISQGGLQSTDEAIDRGVPLVGIPFIVDQENNVQKYVHHGIGVLLHSRTLTADGLKNAVLTVTNDKKYRVNIRKLRAIIKDQPETSMERAIWWVEYLLRHGTAKHLQAPYISGANSYILILVAGLIISAFLNFVFLFRSTIRFAIPGVLKNKRNQEKID